MPARDERVANRGRSNGRRGRKQGGDYGEKTERAAVSASRTS
jgi:hypothetical protein